MCNITTKKVITTEVNLKLNEKIIMQKLTKNCSKLARIKIQSSTSISETKN